jgi:hypothetical protein
MKTALVSLFVLAVFAVLFFLSLAPWATPKEWRTGSAGVPKPTPPRSPELEPPPLAGLPPLLFALASVESGNQPTAIGPSGERSAWQFTPETWARHTRVPFLYASSDRTHAREVAELHLAYLTTELAARHIAPTPEHLAAAWHYGPASARICRDTDYSRRVARLTRSLTPTLVHP